MEFIKDLLFPYVVFYFPFIFPYLSLFFLIFLCLSLIFKAFIASFSIKLSFSHACRRHVSFFSRLSFPSLYFPRLCHPYVITTVGLFYYYVIITSLLRHLPKRPSLKLMGRHGGVLRAFSLDPFLPRCALRCIY